MMYRIPMALLFFRVSRGQRALSAYKCRDMKQNAKAAKRFSDACSASKCSNGSRALSNLVNVWGFRSVCGRCCVLEQAKHVVGVPFRTRNNANLHRWPLKCQHANDVVLVSPLSTHLPFAS